MLRVAKLTSSTSTHWWLFRNTFGRDLASWQDAHGLAALQRTSQVGGFVWAQRRCLGGSCAREWYEPVSFKCDWPQSKFEVHMHVTVPNKAHGPNSAEEAVEVIQNLQPDVVFLGTHDEAYDGILAALSPKQMKDGTALLKADLVIDHPDGHYIQVIQHCLQKKVHTFPYHLHPFKLAGIQAQRYLFYQPLELARFAYWIIYKGRAGFNEDDYREVTRRSLPRMWRLFYQENIYFSLNMILHFLYEGTGQRQLASVPEDVRVLRQQRYSLPDRPYAIPDGGKVLILASHSWWRELTDTLSKVLPKGFETAPNYVTLMSMASTRPESAMGLVGLVVLVPTLVVLWFTFRMMAKFLRALFVPPVYYLGGDEYIKKQEELQARLDRGESVDLNSVDLTGSEKENLKRVEITGKFPYLKFNDPVRA
uniref:Uncharacterized protein n=1 Tax=Chromera velia CCMP2878 TaxID=1169474 RepID=A0A0G4IEZ7_9ALVE|eukprot:Cvel_2420.t1-p1 / transcript=Cvel_2420.t1 / gene=Cvel_2420 / organism=Chromera_velia_CCMP2878 / gene_product=hypothetical protein / transcript_product=hypothetical protein / location=Cvel_scaffold94:106944-114570(+) / protein_length=421 / sequence_SO=supercontig / SO=protein_coding / is_pseudo=false